MKTEEQKKKEEMCYIIPLLMEFRKAHSTENELC